MSTGKVSITLSFESEAELLEWAKDRMHGITAGTILWEFDNWLRRETKYTEEKEWPDAGKIRDYLWDLCADSDYDIYS